MEVIMYLLVMLVLRFALSVALFMITRGILQYYVLYQAKSMGIAFKAGPRLGVQYQYSDSDLVESYSYLKACLVLLEVNNILRKGGYKVFNQGGQSSLGFPGWPEGKEPIPQKLTEYIICNGLYSKEAYPAVAA